MIKKWYQPWGLVATRKISQTLEERTKITLLSLFFLLVSPRSASALSFQGVRMALAARLRPSALLGCARRHQQRSVTKKPASTARLRSTSPHLFSSPPALASAAALPPIHRRGQLSESPLVTLATSSGSLESRDGQQQEQKQQSTFRQRLAAAQASKKKPPPLPARLLSSFLATSSVPYR